MISLGSILLSAARIFVRPQPMLRTSGEIASPEARAQEIEKPDLRGLLQEMREHQHGMLLSEHAQKNTAAALIVAFRKDRFEICEGASRYADGFPNVKAFRSKNDRA